MNKIFKVIWSKAKHCYIVASELAKSHSKSNSSRTIRKSIAALGIAVAFYIAAGSAIAANGGGDLDLNTGDYTGNSQYNYTVTIDSNVDGKVYGRKEDSNTSEKATVNISGGTVNGFVYGGYSYYGEVASNSVKISGGTVNSDVYGGCMKKSSGGEILFSDSVL